MSLDLSKLSNLRRNGAGWTAACPICRSAGSDKSGNHLGILSDGKFNCVVDSSATHRSAIFAAVGIGGTGEVAAPVAEQVTVDRTWPLNTLDRLVKDYSYWEKRGIDAATLEPFRGGVATQGMLANRFVFPIFSENGSEIIGFNGRRIDGKSEMKWKIIGKSSRFIWGGLDEIEGRVILTESIGDSLMLRQHGVPDTLCLFGLNMSEAILGWLIAHNPHQIIISTNRDASGAGQQAAQKIERTLWKFFEREQVLTIHPTGCKDWGEASAQQIKDAFLAEKPAASPAELDLRTPFEKGLDSTEISEIIHE